VRFLRRVVDVRDDEVRAMLVSFAYFFCVLCGWFVLRPIRDAVAATANAPQMIPRLFAGTLVVTLIFNPIFSSLVVRYPARRFVPFTYHFFVANLAVFYLLLKFAAPVEGSTGDVWLGRVFFVWTSVFNLFVVSVFWCFMADVFRSDQAKRLFGFIGLGGTLGSIAGSSLTATLAKQVGTTNLFLVSMVLFELAVLAVVKFPVRQDLGRAEAARRDAPIGGSTWAGFTHIVRSRYLSGISVFLVIYVVGSTFLYVAQSKLVGDAYPDRASRTAVLARIDVAGQTLTILVQAFLTGRIIRWIGVGATLAVLPLITMAGFGALAMRPVFLTVAVFTVLRRGLNFALTNPAMESLFTVIPREDKYKAKNLIETFVYRGGDQVGAWAYAGLSALGLAITGVSLVAVPMSIVWLVLGVWLGRRQAEISV
jgi:AAA family ATP:ADP antiporter